MAKVRRFENGLKLSIRGKIVGPRLQDMNSVVRTTLAIEREMEDAQGILDASAGGKRKEDQPSSSLEKETEDFCPTSAPGTGPAEADDMLLLPSAWTYEAGLPIEVWIPGFWAGAVPVINGTSADTVYSSTPQYGSNEPVLVVECYMSTFGSTDRSEGPDYGSRSGTRLTD